MSISGAAALAISQRLVGPTDENTVLFGLAPKQDTLEFPWRRMVFAPGPVPLGVELVSTSVICQLAKERALLSERRCFFCEEPVALDDELHVYLYHPSHVVLVAFFCPACHEEKDAWLRAIHASDKTKATRRCSQCGATSNTVRYLACGACHMVNYCSPECQRGHWLFHKIYCKSIIK